MDHPSPARVAHPPVVTDHGRARRAGIAAFVGTAIEWYDFYVYATAAALVFGPLFFPSGDPLMGVASAFATYAVGFFVRPVGGILIGHIGDRWGRRPALVITLLMMGLSTVAVGLLPTYAQVGALAPAMLLALRVIQGLAVGGEWGGAVLMAVEHAPHRFKTFYGGFAQLGNSAGALAATGIFALLTAQGEAALADGLWRVPFLLSIVLIAVGFWVRYRLEESPVFSTLEPETHRQLPLALALRSNWKVILLIVGMAPVGSGGYYLTTTFATVYADDPSVAVSPTTVLSALSAAAFVELVATLGVAWLGDRFGRKLVLMVGIIGSGVLIAPQFLSLKGPEWGIFASFIMIRLFMTATYAPAATVMAQAFGPAARYTSLSIANGVAAALWSGLAPLTATVLFGATGSIWPVIALFWAFVVISAVCLWLLPQVKDDIVVSPTAPETTTRPVQEGAR